jgi:DNA helicase-2/ATP-dependent DNA helicase PcrA
VNLDSQQAQAVEAGDGPLLILAGAGSGKTAVLTHRVAALLRRGVAPEHILLLTFTQRAAREMVQRVRALAPSGAESIWAGTFHAVALRILRDLAPRLGYGARFGVLTPGDAKDLLREAIDEHLADDARRLPPLQKLLDVVSYMTNANVDLATAWAARSREPLLDPGAVDAALDAYTLCKLTHNVMDYDDLLANLYLLLLEHADVRASMGHQFRHVLVDEYQDTNPVQAALVAIFAERHQNVTVVGDDNQSIYAFRGADIGNIVGFPQRFPRANVLTLTQNYRATPELVAVANDSIGHNPQPFPRTLRSAQASGPRPIWVPVVDSAAQAQWLVGRVRAFVDAGVPLERQAVLYRVNANADAVVEAFAAAGVPARRATGLRLIDRGHVRDILAVIEVDQNPENRSAWRRLCALMPGIGRTAADRIVADLMAEGRPWVALERSPSAPAVRGRARDRFAALRGLLMDLRIQGLGQRPSELVDRLLAIGYAETLRSRHAEDADARALELSVLARTAECQPDPNAYLSTLALGDPRFTGTELAGVTLSTVHRAKGLEWDVVYVIGLTEGVFPLAPALWAPTAMEEERRLFYVATTRARRWLYWLSPAHPRGRSTGLPHPVSRLVGEISPTLYDTQEAI